MKKLLAPILAGFLWVCALGITLAACAENSGDDSVWDMFQGESQQASTSSDEWDNNQLLFPGAGRLTDEERKLRKNPACGKFGGDMKPVVQIVVKKFNETIAKNPRFGAVRLVPVGYPKIARGISIRVCDDSRIAAYSYTKTVVIHDGLLKTLREAAGAMALEKHGGKALDIRLDEISQEAMNGKFGKNYKSKDYRRIKRVRQISRQARELTISAVAFVLYHELGHAQMGHALITGKSLEFNEYSESFNEFYADMFATKIMMASGISLKGADLVFGILSRMNPHGAAGHPASRERELMIQRLENDKRIDEPLAATESGIGID